LASSEEVGNGGGNFKLYLSDMHGGFHDMGSLVMSSAARAVPVKPGSAKLFSCWHLSAANSNPYGYLIDGLEVKAIPAEPGYPGCGQDNTTYDVCRWKDWKQSGKCEWHTWHELEQLDKRSKENPVSSESKSP
jgi:hypothetical protein